VYILQVIKSYNLSLFKAGKLTAYSFLQKKKRSSVLLLISIQRERLWCSATKKGLLFTSGLFLWLVGNTTFLQKRWAAAG